MAKGKNHSSVRARKLGYYIWNRLCEGVGMVSQRGTDIGARPGVVAATRAKDLGMGRNKKLIIKLQ